MNSCLGKSIEGQEMLPFVAKSQTLLIVHLLQTVQCCQTGPRMLTLMLESTALMQLLAEIVACMLPYLCQDSVGHLQVSVS